MARKLLKKKVQIIGEIRLLVTYAAQVFPIKRERERHSLSNAACVVMYWWAFKSAAWSLC